MKRLDQATQDANGIKRELAVVIGTVRGQRDQRERMIWAIAIGLWVGLIVGMATFNPIMNALSYMVSTL